MKLFSLVKTLTRKEFSILALYKVSGLALLLYSFTQIDLGLVISRFPFLYSFEKTFQQIGYFNRPLSTTLYFVLVSIFLGLYLYTVTQVQKKQISRNALWLIIIAVSIVLFLSYNAFSYDLFNYIFDAKILTHYHANPYLHKALDYPGDPMLAFMHWTHRTYPYGPIWLALTVPLSYLGMNFFIVTFYLIKVLLIGMYLGTCYFIGRILQKISPQSELSGVALFALNPLVLFETHVSGHNDISMMFFLVWSLFLLLSKKKGGSIILFLLSIGTKFATVFFLPVYILIYRKKVMTEAYWNTVMLWGNGLLFIAMLVASYRSNFQPWYLLFFLPTISLLIFRRTILYPVAFLSLVALCNYLQYLFTGTWTTESMNQLFIINSIGGCIGVIWFLYQLTKNEN